ncbi:hypothetical protein [Streptomyces hydrogenans]|uniref:hypothetical protein n=1 Tax=Streptomyces hydrogenans TaxID=1873719 RepID=UPI0038219BA8
MTAPKRGEYLVTAVSDASPHATFLEWNGIEQGARIYVTRLAPLSIQTPKGEFLDLSESQWEALSLSYEGERPLT